MPEVATSTRHSVDALRALDQRIDTAVSRRDAATLESVLADDFIYTHSNGKSQSKAEYIEAIAKRDNPPARIDSGIGVEFHDDIAITRGDLDIEYRDDRPNLYMRYVRVYRLSDDRWRPISHRTVYATDRNP